MDGLGEDLVESGCEDQPFEWKSNPAENKSNEKELVPGVGDWSPSDGKISQIWKSAII